MSVEEQVITKGSIKLGSTVKEIDNGFKGVVDREALNFWKVFSGTSVEARAWLGYQMHPFTDEQVNNERWFHVVVPNGGGSFFSCESRLTLLASPSTAPDPDKCPLEPWTIWARIMAMESETGSTCLYLEDRSESWRGELPLLFLDSTRIKPEIGDLIEGDAGRVLIHHQNKVYEFAREDDSLTQVFKKKQ